MFSIRGRWTKLPIQTKASFAYMFGNVVSKSVALLSLPIFTRLMSTNDIGVGTTYQSWYAVLYSIVTLSLCSGSINVAMMDYSEERDRYQSTCLALASLSTIIFSGLYIIFYKTINKYTTLDTSVMVVMILCLFFCPALDFWYARQRYEYKYKTSVFVSCFVTIISTLVAIIFVIVFKNIKGFDLGNVKVISQGLVSVMISSVFYYILIKNGKTIFDFSIWKYALGLSLPLIIHSLSKNLLDISDRIMISYMCGKADAGIYGTIYSLASVILIVWTAVNTALIPSVFEELKTEKYEGISKIYVPLLFAFGGVAVMVSLLSPDVIMLMTTKDYVEASNIVPAIISGVYFTALYTMYGNFILYKKKTVYLMFATLGAALVNILLNYCFIGMFGYKAAAYTTLVSFVLLAIFQGIMVKIIFKKNIVNDFLLFAISCCVCVICILSVFLYKYNIIRYILVIFILFITVFNKDRLLFLLRKGNKEND